MHRCPLENGLETPTYRFCFCTTANRSYRDGVQLLETLETLGEVTTHLSVIGMTIVKGR